MGCCCSKPITDDEKDVQNYECRKDKRNRARPRESSAAQQIASCSNSPRTNISGREDEIVSVKVRDDDHRQRDDNKHQESQWSNLEEKYQQEEDEIEVEERQTKESLEENKEKEEKDEMKEEEEEEDEGEGEEGEGEEESVREYENKPKQHKDEETKNYVEVASRDVERETRKRKETIGSISEASAVNEQILTSSKSIGEEEKNSKQDSASSSNVDNRTKQQLSDFDCMTASPVDMSCSSTAIGQLSCTYICMLSVHKSSPLVI
ncbi:glutamic acid-rich protein-like [Corticium candelabrum]|uniref:glutamic acid-rich protein-like n=1 Tax=Corticium candelabrum TaxID=121492 RepID=UPI002E255816|nr:glutamic acid-rich protein-like [Corticium candelabrum]